MSAALPKSQDAEPPSDESSSLVPLPLLGGAEPMPPMRMPLKCTAAAPAPESSVGGRVQHEFVTYANPGGRSFGKAERERDLLARRALLEGDVTDLGALAAAEPALREVTHAYSCCVCFDDFLLRAMARAPRRDGGCRARAWRVRVRVCCGG